MYSLTVPNMRVTMKHKLYFPVESSLTYLFIKLPVICTRFIQFMAV